MADLGWPEMLIIAIAAMVLFGWKRLPDASRSLGRSIRVFRSEIAGMRTDAEGEPVPTDAAASDSTAPDATAPHVAASEVTPSHVDAAAPVTPSEVSPTPLRPE